jgi:hypothetical protein
VLLLSFPQILPNTVTLPGKQTLRLILKRFPRLVSSDEGFVKSKNGSQHQQQQQQQQQQQH